MKPHLLMLHGAIGASSQLQYVAGLLSPKYEIHLFDFPGHGGKELNEENFSIELFANAVVSFLKDQKIPQINIFGYSMGGYVAVYLAKHHPELINKIITLGTKFHWNKETAANEVKMLDPEKIAVKIPFFAKALETLHHPGDWKTVLQKTASMLIDMGNNNPVSQSDFKELDHHILLMSGDRDKMIPVHETEDIYLQLKNGQMAILPATPHPIDQVDPSIVAYFIERFLF